MITPYQVKELEKISKLNKDNKSQEWAIIADVLYQLAKEHVKDN